MAGFDLAAGEELLQYLIGDRDRLDPEIVVTGAGIRGARHAFTSSGNHGSDRPAMGACGRWTQNTGLSVQGQRGVPVLAASSEDGQRVRKLVVDLEHVAVGVVEVDALLADVVDRTENLHAMLPERGVRVLEPGLALHT